MLLFIDPANAHKFIFLYSATLSSFIIAAHDNPHRFGLYPAFGTAHYMGKNKFFSFFFSCVDACRLAPWHAPG